METAALIKFGDYDHLCSLRDKGEIFMNNLPYFWKIEDDELRGDPCDSVDEIHRGSKGHGEILSTGHKFQISSFVLRIGPDTPETINLFCMYAMRPKHGTYPIDEKNFKFGTHALIFFNSQELINRLSTFIKNKAVPAKANLVEYIDTDHSGTTGPFRKLNTFEYQSEWRLVCYDGPGKERTLIIGSLSDISVLVEAKNINKEITFSPNKRLEEGLTSSPAPRPASQP